MSNVVGFWIVKVMSLVEVEVIPTSQYNYSYLIQASRPLYMCVPGICIHFELKCCNYNYNITSNIDIAHSQLIKTT